jgi:site-specific DNA recombinase
MDYTVNGSSEKIIRCAIYTRKSTENGLDQDFNTLDAQRESCENYIKSQASRGWSIIPTKYDDGGFTGANIERPAYSRLIADIRAGKVDMVLVYKVDRLSRSLADFANIMAMFNEAGVSFVSITQHFDTSSSLGRMTLNILITFAQFEREMIAERISDKIASSRKRGKYIGGIPVLGYDVENKKLIPNYDEANQIKSIFNLYLERESVKQTALQLNKWGWTTKRWITKKGKATGGLKFSPMNVHSLITNPVFIGKVTYKKEIYEGEHNGIVDEKIFNDVQTLLKKNKNGNHASKRRKLYAMLRGILYCGKCGHRMSYTYSKKTTDKKAYYYYVCSNKLKNTKQACNSRPLPAVKTEEFVVSHISKLGQNNHVIDALILKAQNDKTLHIAKLQDEKSSIEYNLELAIKQKDILAENPDGDNYLINKDHIERLKTQINEISYKISSLNNLEVNAKEVSTVLTKFMPIWDSLTQQRKERVLNLIFDKVTWRSDEESLDFVFNPIGISLLKNGGAFEYIS